MKKSILITFLVHGKQVEELEGDRSLKEIEDTKSLIASMHGVTYDDVEVAKADIEVPDVNWNLVINEKGVLMTKADNIYSTFREVTGVCPAYDISKEELFHDFLGLISKKDFDSALIFTFKY